ncbi:MAG: hypothetical protein H0X71_06705 [Rubrobacter sp.]|nr:hypothetical protein [Rubrobacter sp.]
MVAPQVKQQPEAGRTGAASILMDEQPGESIVKPLPRELPHDYGRNAEMRWEAMADQGYETPNTRFYIRSRGPTPK